MNNVFSMNLISSRTPHNLRRGNTLVLVIGILVLLVIIATAYVTRTQAGRLTATAQQASELRDDSIDTIADGFAQMLADQLFVNPIDTTDPFYVSTGIVNANTRRLGILPNAVRYGRDMQDIAPPPGGDGYPDFPYNRASYSVNPHTNWPDPDGSITMPFNLWPPGPGNLNGPTTGILSAEGNEIGWPGFGDGRIFRDLEPLRKTTGAASTPINDAPSHYRHLSYLGTIDNGWRIATDISDIFDANNDGFGSLVTNLNIPCEQWLAISPPNLHNNLSPPYECGAFVRPTFMQEWADWFGLSNPANPLAAYASIYADPARIPANYYRLKDLDDDISYHDPGERPQDEFIPGTTRWLVSRILADTDGDGFTDSFWWLSPMPVQNGIRQVVAVSVIDNCGMINVNVAGQFLRDGVGRKTRGWGPFDLALTGQMGDPLFRNNWNVGFFDNPDHQFRPTPPFLGYSNGFSFNTTLDASFTRPWQRHLTEMGYPAATQIPSAGPPAVPTTAARLDFWQRCSSQPQSTDTTSLYRPFNFDSEIELRMFAGANYPWIFSQFEYSMQDYTGGLVGLLRSNLYGYEENTEIRDQRSGREFLVDSRHRATTHSAARNDIAPPWLWPFQPGFDLNGDGLVDFNDDALFSVSERKVDLRMNAGAQLVGNFNNNPSGFVQFGAATHQNVGIVLRNLLERSLMDPINVPSARNTYYGNDVASVPTSVVKTERLAAAMAANINEARDPDANALVADAVVVNDPTLSTEAFLGMERQPFLVEAFIAHVHGTQTAMFDHPPFIVVGDNIVCHGVASTIVVVQVANPFDTSIDLSNFKIKVFGNAAPLSTILPPDSLATFYSIEDNATVMPLLPDGTNPNYQPWMRFLGLDQATANAVAVQPGTWSVDLLDYEMASDKRAIELTRNDTNPGNVPIDVVVDRIDVRSTDDFGFGEAVTDDMETAAPTGTCAEPLPSLPWDNVLVITPNTNWVQWARVTRGWQLGDQNGNGMIDPAERIPNPRYIFPDRLLDLSAVNGYQYSHANYGAPGGWGFASPTTFPGKIKGVFPVSNPANIFPPVGYERMQFPLQMLQKDGPFDQIGELLNVWMYGHQIKIQAGSNPPILDDTSNDGGTVQTFTEYLAENPYDPTPSPGGAHFKLVGHDVRVNRLRSTPADLEDKPNDLVAPGAPNAGLVIGYDPVGNYFDPRHAGPALPAAVRMFDGFVCDGPGLAGGTVFSNAKNFDGTATPGLININTAPYEVMQAIPHWYRLVHETGINRFDNSPTYILPPGIAGPPMPLVSGNGDPNARLPRSMIPEALKQYIERSDGAVGGTGYPFGPDYSGRGNPPSDPMAFLAYMRCGRGIESIGEVALLTQPGQDTVGESPSAPAWPIIPQQWRVDLDLASRWDFVSGSQFNGFVPFVDAGGNPESVRISTDDTNPRVGTPTPVEQPDDVALDAEEMNLLFASASNMITTRSDTFTVYFRVRSFRQNTSVSPPVWDATNPEYIIDDSRYVMLVDRSTVNKPGDKPKILYMEKLPN